jgi:hypothetical protein
VALWREPRGADSSSSVPTLRGFVLKTARVMVHVSEDKPQLRSRARVASDLFIAGFLLTQLALPLRYYLGGGGADERFSWRMFSSVRMQRCEVDVDDIVEREGQRVPRRVDLRATIHGAWVNILERYRPAAVEKMLQRRCALSEVRRARYTRHCKNPDGSKQPPLVVEMDCERGESHITQGRP